MLRRALAIALGTCVLGTLPASAGTDDPTVHSPAYVARDVQNVADAYGRVTGPGGQLANPAYLPALATATPAQHLAQLLTQTATPTRPALTAGTVVPGWDVGNPLRAGWDGARGLSERVAFTNRYGALLRGTVYGPRPGARDPYTGERLRGPFPGVVITPGSVQGSEGMYRWLAQDLAERGYVVLTFDVQGQGASETFPHEGPPLGGPDALPFCEPLAAPRNGEMTGCPGVPSQQLANFELGTVDALDFFVSTPDSPYANPSSSDVDVDRHNPYWRLWDRRPDPRPETPGRITRLALVGHSMGAAAVSKVQTYDARVAAVVALDKLTGPDGPAPFEGLDNAPVVPALGLQAEYGFTVAPYTLQGGSSLNPAPSPDGPEPRREKQTGYDAWRAAGVDSMVVVPRASTHLEWTDIPLVMPASRYGQALSSHYAQAWLDRYLKHADNARALTGTRFRYLEPRGAGVWKSITLERDELLSFYYCSAYSFRSGGHRLDDEDLAGVGC